MKNFSYSVSQVNNYIKLLFDSDSLLENISIQGEVYNLKFHHSGHIYFSIKDSSSHLNCVIFKNDSLDLNLNLENGTNIIAIGNISSYPKSSYYQFYIKSFEKIGQGDNDKEFQTLKKKLASEGLFDTKFKKTLPFFPKNIGIITSLSGAAIWDIIKVYKSINPVSNLILIPSLVQGENAHTYLIDAIEDANLYANLDIIILARGGGDYEDLNCFNNEQLARVIFNSTIPIVTGIGHETDFTIADFVADFRAPTPSAAIECVLPKLSSLNQTLQFYQNTLNSIIAEKINTQKDTLLNYIDRYYFKNFGHLTLHYKSFLQRFSENFNSILPNKIYQHNLLLQNYLNLLNLNSPSNIMKKGYTFITDENDSQIYSSNSICKGDCVKINFSDGSVNARIF